ncbi:Cysteine desulfurase [Candidatus Westeberhardia cardiocondylae]|uniref:Cysteine desulfurase n=1 Tax=Candidatus Westeberhardia cardiocondylae TaxID=1594731 RepID=A0A0H5C5I0_9ENTR|nr:SufS family cysteine desulfurase [Candidatus Westeberhardia cardiocondylae]MCR3756315.1 L-cysteine desulfurase [Candidatus Westeberhardia cardiocondylae]CEN32216.1 Cysteine desulfurase [Candidatus Westeberhardia cardiocondylae]
MIINHQTIKNDFPILSKKINNYPLTYLDNAASAQKPKSVINSIVQYYQEEYSSTHRGIHYLSNYATERIENIRSQIAKFINAKSEKEIIFVKGTTEGINLVANTWGKKFLHPNDNIIITEMEHHANIVPWQMLAEEKKLILRYIPLLPNGTLDVTKLPFLINKKTKLLAITHISNVLGTMNPIKQLIKKVRETSDAVILIDGAQAIMHKKVDVQKLDCDFYVFSGHKLYGPSGIGILYTKKKILNIMPPWEGGGSMIKKVSLTKKTTFNNIPWKFEAGSLHSSGIIGLGAAIKYIQKIGLNYIENYEKKLMRYTLTLLKKIPNLILYGTDNKIGIISFNLKKHHAYDVGSLLDQYGIAIRTGHHCAMPLVSYFKVQSMCRISFAIYTTKEDIDRLINSLIQIQYILNNKKNKIS